MFKVLLEKIKALFSPMESMPTIDDVYVSFFQTSKVYPSGQHQIEMFYNGMMVETAVNEWSSLILTTDILAAKYDYTDIDNETSNLIRSIFSIRHSRSVSIQVTDSTILRLNYTFFTNEKQMQKFHGKINPTANNSVAQAFMRKM